MQATTTEETDELPAKSKACTDAGKPAIEIVKFDGQDAATNAVVLGQADAMSADSPVTLYAIKQSNGKLEPGRRDLRCRAVRLAGEEGLAAGAVAAEGARAPDRDRHLQADRAPTGVSRRDDRQAGDQRRDQLTFEDCTMTDVDTSPATTPAAIDAVPLRHPWRWVAAVVIVILVGAVPLRRGHQRRPTAGTSSRSTSSTSGCCQVGLVNTLQLTIYSMVLAIVLGVLLAVMRLSPNPVFKSVSWVYLWIFRGTPIYVQLVFWGLIPTIYANIQLGVPFGPSFFHLNLQALSIPFLLAILGLALNEAAYMAEIIRAGISSVPEGQLEASTALGMSWGMTMRRTVLPQAMRVIIPPTGNEVISMLKTTSLVTAVPFTPRPVRHHLPRDRRPRVRAGSRCCWWRRPGTWWSPAS